MHFTRFLALSLLLLGPAARAQEGVSGRYRLTGEHDVASELVLNKDHTFDYFLAAGALDEHAKGRWTADGDRIRLETLPIPNPPVITMGVGSRSSDTLLTVNVRWPNGQGIAAVDLEVGFDTGEVVRDYTQEYGWSLSEDERRAPRWIKLAVPMHHLESQRFAIDTTKSNVLAFTLVPNDLGVVNFAAFVVETRAGRLIVHRDGAALNYVK